MIIDIIHGLSNFSDNKTMISWKKYLENVIIDFKTNGYNFNHIETMNIITRSNEKDMTYGFYIKQNMHAAEWKLNAMTNKNKKLLIKFPETWRHPLNNKNLKQLGLIIMNLSFFYTYK